MMDKRDVNGQLQKGHGGYWKGKKLTNKHKEKLKNAFSGHKNHQWKNGIHFTRDGYIAIYAPWHPNCDKQNYYLLHRLMAEKYLNRHLNPKEIIHHINENKSDNNPNNLYLFKSLGWHLNYHVELNKGKIKPITKSNLC